MTPIDHDPQRPNGAAVAAAVVVFFVFAPAAIFSIGAAVAAALRAVRVL
ncbi:hypothetical protein [Leifsonia sp. WHRI 6310E]